MQWVQELSPAARAQLVAMARQAVARQPDNAACWRMLADALFKAGNFGEADMCLREACLRFPENAELLTYHTLTLERLGAHERAFETATAAVKIAPERSALRDLQLEVLSQLKNWTGAPQTLIATAGQPTAGQVQSPAAFRVTARSRIHSGALSELVEDCKSYLARHPGDTNATFYLATTLAKLGRDEEANAVLALDRFLEVAMLPPSDEFASAAEFLERLAAEILRNPSLVPDPRGRATRQGQQTLHLRQADMPAVEALITQIKLAVDAYAARLTGSTHGFANAQPAKAKLNAWAVVSGAGGRQQRHHHGSAWLSGVFYVAAPRAEAGGKFLGDLILGALHEEQDDQNPRSGALKIEPVPGRLVMFPSYVPHATIPPSIDGRRIVVAFDVMPHNAGFNLAHADQ